MTKPRKPGGSRQGRGGKRQPRGKGVSRNGVSYVGASKTACPTGKWAWWEKAGAKTLLRALRKAGDHGSRVYRCPTCDLFHVGHLPTIVRDGRKSAGDIYGR